MRRVLFLAAVLGTQFLTGCYCAYPAFPRLQSGFGCGYGGCGTPLIHRPLVAPYRAVAPAATPAYSAGVPAASLPSYPLSGDVGYPIGSPSAPLGCNGCGAAAPGTVSGYPVGDGMHSGIPLSSVPPMGYQPVPAVIPYMNPPGTYPGMPIANAPMPQPIPSAMPGGVPHDSALLKMPTIMPPSTSKRPAELARETTTPR